MQVGLLVVPAILYGDGIKDLLIGATRIGNNGNGIDGESYVIFGKEGGFSSTIDLSNIGLNDGLKIISDDPNNLGYSVSDAGDINMVIVLAAVMSLLILIQERAIALP